MWVGFSDIVLLWFQSYLNNRTFSLAFGNALSYTAHLTFRVPQGLVLVLLLFSFHMGALWDIFCKYIIKVHFYANDTPLYIFCAECPSLSCSLIITSNCSVFNSPSFWSIITFAVYQSAINLYHLGVPIWLWPHVWCLTQESCTVLLSLFENILGRFCFPLLTWRRLTMLLFYPV